MSARVVVPRGPFSLAASMRFAEGFTPDPHAPDAATLLIAGGGATTATEEEAEEAAEAARRVLRDWPRLSREARECAVEVFDSAKNLRKILALQAAKGSPLCLLR